MDSVRAAWPLFQAAGSGSIPTSTLQLRLFEITPRRAMNLNAEWHSILPKTHLGNLVGSIRSAFYGAEYAGRWYGVGIWTDPIAANRILNGFQMLELRRLAIAPDAPRNTASRMLGVMAKLLKKKFPDVVKLLSYQSLEHHKGTIYRASGWTSGPITKYQRWDSPKLGRSHVGTPQITSNKVRWERDL